MVPDSSSVIWLRPASAGPVRCDAPVFEGEPRRVARVVHALRRVPLSSGDGNLVDGHLIRRLRVVAGEAELELSFTPATVDERVTAEQAFQALRRTLPNTDVYVAHAA